MPANTTKNSAVLRTRLKRFVTALQSRIVAEWKATALRGWNAQQAIGSLCGGVAAVRLPSSSMPDVSGKSDEVISMLVEGFYHDFMDLLGGSSAKEVLGKQRVFPHRTPQGGRLTLAYYLEALFAGEDTLGDCLLADRFEMVPFSDAEAVACFDEVNRIFKILSESLAGGFCHDCAAPLSAKQKSVADLEQGLMQRNSHG